MASEIRLVCFDWGGVIVEICRSWPEAFACAGLATAGEALSEARFAQLRELVVGVQTARLDEWSFCQLVGDEVGIEAEALLAAHRAMLKREYPGIDVLVDRLHAIPGLATALLSNTSAMHFAEQTPGPDGSPPRFPTAGRLHYRIASHLVGIAKPERGIYEALEATTGCRGREILFFDDLEENVTAACAHGWHAVQIDPTNDPPAQMRHALAEHGIL